jgi:MFS family permease
MPRPEPPELAHLRPSRQAHTNRHPVIIGQTLSLLGDYIAYFTLPWLILDITGQGSDLGLIAFSETVPVLLFGFTAGVILDRYRIRSVLIGADLVRALVFASLAAAVAFDVVRPGMLFAGAFVFGSMTVVFDAGLQAMLPNVVASGDLVVVNSRLSLARTLGFAVGPALGGLIIAYGGGFAMALGVDAATFLISAVLLTRVRELHSVTKLSGRSGFRFSLGRGLRFLARNPHLRWATAGAAVANFVFAPLEALLVLFVDERIAGMAAVPAAFEWLFSGAAEVGLFIGLQAAIGSLGVVMAPRLAKRFSLGRIYVVGILMLGAGFAVVALMSSFWAVVPAGIAAAGVGWVNVAFVTMRQQVTPEALLGRVTAASRTISYFLIPLGAAVGGYAADAFGLVPVYLAGPLAILATAALLMLTPLWWAPIPEAPHPDWASEAMQSAGLPRRPSRR